MSRSFEVITPEQVAIQYELAGFGSRALAALIDSLLQLILMVLLGLVGLFAIGSAAETLGSWDKFAGSFLMGFFIVGFFVIFWGYSIFFETLWNGETPGKRLLRLRVMKDGGHPVDFRAVVIRNLLRAVDVLPGIPPLAPLYGFALISVLCNNQYKRLGDLAAGTIVVRHGQEDDPRQQMTFGDAIVFRLLDAKSQSQLSSLTREEFRLVQRFLEKRHALTQPLRSEFARRLAAPLMEKIGYALPAVGIDYERWLDELHLAYRTHAFGPGPLSTTSIPAQVAAPPKTPINPDLSLADEDLRKW